MLNLVMTINYWVKQMQLAKIVNRFKNHRTVLIIHHAVQLLIRNLTVSRVFFYPSSKTFFSCQLDKLTLVFNGSQPVPLLNTDIAWTTDKAVKFKNPNNASTCKYFKFFSV